MTDLFISYSRKNKPFVQRLYHCLKDEGRDAWVDWEDIPPASHFPAEIQAGIEGTDTFAPLI